MNYKIGTISRQSGLAVQTIREYADRGLLEMDKDDKSNYRYFDANAVNKTSAIRRLRMMGFTLDEVSDILSNATHERYHQFVGDLIERTRRRIESLEEIRGLLENHSRQLELYDKTLYQG
ncbi:MAG: MerR family transcriptional regulator, partial [Clostridia bacterium]|nr:MerR family transcriptional regulator [Clostridia bacterium]